MYFLSKLHRLEKPGDWCFWWLQVPVAWGLTAVYLIGNNVFNVLLVALLLEFLAWMLALMYAVSLKDKWYDRCPLSGGELVAIRDRLERLMAEKPKQQGWVDLIFHARQITVPEAPDFVYTMLTAIYVQEKRTSTHWVADEAKKYIRSHPIENHIVRRAWKPI